VSTQEKRDDFATIEAPGTKPKITSIFDFSAEALGQLKLWFEQAGIVGLGSVAATTTTTTSGTSVYDRSTTLTDIVSTTAETTLYSKTINATDMSIDKILRCTIIGDWLNSTGSGRTFRLKIKFGGTTMLDSLTDSFASAAQRGTVYIQFSLGNMGATNSQFMQGFSSLNRVSPTTGLGSFGATPTGNEFAQAFGASALATVDTSAAQLLDVTITPSASSSSLSFRKRHALLELI